MSGLQELKEQHREVARLKFEGFKPTEISERLGMSLQTVYGIQSDPLFKQEVERLNDRADEQVIDVRKKLSEMAITATQKLEELLDCDHDQTRLRAAQDVLDRAGYSPKQRFESFHVNMNIDTEKINELKQRAKSAGAVVSDDEESEENGASLLAGSYAEDSKNNF